MSDGIQIKWEPATKGKKGQAIRSQYTPDGRFPKRGMHLPVIRTAADLKAFAAQLPDSLPIEGPFGDAVRGTWFNVGESTEHLRIDGADEDDDGEGVNDEEDEID